MGVCVTTAKQQNHTEKNISRIHPYQTSKPTTSTNDSLILHNEIESENLQISLSLLDDSIISGQNSTKNTIVNQNYLAKEDRDLSKISNSSKQSDTNQKSSMSLDFTNTDLDQNEIVIANSSDEDSISLEENHINVQFSDDRRSGSDYYRKNQNDHKKVDSLYKHVLKKTLHQFNESVINSTKNRLKKLNNVKIEKEKSRFYGENFGMELSSYGQYVEDIVKLKKRKSKRHIINSLTKEPQNNSLDSNYKTSDYLSETELCNIKDNNLDSQIINNSKNIMKNQVLNGNFIEENFVENDKDMLEKINKAITLNTNDSSHKNAIDNSNGSIIKINGIKYEIKKCHFLSPERKKSNTVYFSDQKNLQKLKNFGGKLNSVTQKSSMTNDNYLSQGKKAYGNYTKLSDFRIVQLENSEINVSDDQSWDNLSRQEKNIDKFQVKMTKNNLTKKNSFEKLDLLNIQTNQQTKKLYHSPQVSSVSLHQKEVSKANLQLNRKITTSSLISENANYHNFQMINFSNAKHEFDNYKLKTLEKCKDIIFKRQSSITQANVTYETLVKNSNLKMRRKNGSVSQDSQMEKSSFQNPIRRNQKNQHRMHEIT